MGDFSIGVWGLRAAPTRLVGVVAACSDDDGRVLAVHWFTPGLGNITYYCFALSTNLRNILTSNLTIAFCFFR